MNKFLTILAAAAVAVTLAATPVLAQPAIDAAGAAAVRETVEDALAFHIEARKKTGVGIATGGDITVTPRDSYYEVKIPGVVLGGEKGDLDVGTVMMNVTPEADGDYRTSVALPQTMTMKDKEGRGTMDITLGQQKFSGVWRPALKVFTQAEADYRDVSAVITPAGDKAAQLGTITLRIGALYTQIAMKPDGDLWSGPQATRASDVSLTFGQGQRNRLAVERINARVDYKKIDLALGQQLRAQVQKHIEEDGREVSPQAVRDIMQSSFGDLRAMPESVDSAFDIAGLSVDLAADEGRAATADTPARGPRGPVAIRLESFNSNSTTSGLKTDAGSTRGAFKLGGLDIKGVNTPLAGVIPTDASFNISGSAIPFKSAIAAFMTAIDNTLEAQTAASSDAEAKAQGRLYLQQALASLPPLFAKAGTSFTVSDSYTRAPDLSSTLAGKLDAAAGAPFGFLGHMTLSLTGMDELIAKLQETARVSGDPKAAGFAQMLILAQLSGQADKAPDGKSRRTYALELKPDGITLNGVDMRAMLPGTPGAPPSATP